MNKKGKKSNTIKAAFISAGAVIIAAIVYGIFSMINPGKPNKTIQNEIIVSDFASVEETNNQNDIEGDFISGEKVENIDNFQSDESVIEAPNALIVTKDQSGGNNTVNLNISSQSYQKPSKELINTISRNFDKLNSKYKHTPKIIIEVESGNSMRHKVALDLEQFLIAKNMGYYPKGNTFIGRFPHYPITIFSSSKNKNYTIEFINSIKPYLDSFFFIDTTFRNDEYIKMYINGTPNFNTIGSVKFD